MTQTRKLDIAQELKTEEDIRLFLEASFEDAKDDLEPTALLHALGTAARARDRLKTAKESNRYQAIINEGDPPLSAVCEITHALGYRLAVVPL